MKKCEVWVLALVLVAGCDASSRVANDLGGGGGGGNLDGHLAGAEDLSGPSPDLPIVDNATIYAHEANTLYLVDPVTFNLTTVGSFGATESMTDLAITPDGKIYTISKTSVYLVDPATAHATELVKNLNNSTTNVALTFQTDGTLLASDQTGKVRVIDPTTGTVTEIGAYGSGFDTAGDLVAVADGTMFGISASGPQSTSSSNVLIKVNPQTGVAVGVGPIGYVGVFGTAYSNGRVLAFTKTGQIIRIDPKTGAGTLVKTYSGKVFYGAGTSPLVPIG
jgi:hypothetical protein